MATARERLNDSPELRAAVEKKLKEGLLARLGVEHEFVGGNGDRAPAPGETLESMEAPLDVEALEGVAPDDALEAIVALVGRPPLLVQNDQVVLDDPDALIEFPAGTDAKIVGTHKWIPSVGRVEFKNFDMPWGGTGWVVAAEGNDRIIVTNRHVAGLVARRTGDGKGVFLRSAAQVRFGASVDFNEEFGATPELARSFDVVDIPFLADTTQPDVAFLRVRGANLPSPMALADSPAAIGDVVALIGYPARDRRNDANAMSRYFRDLYDVKRYAPGKVVQALSPGEGLRHDCTSLGGNSGSPLIRLSDGKVVGLHFAGLFGKENFAVAASTIKQLLDGARPTAVLGVAATITEGAGDGAHTAEQLRGRGGYDPDFLGGDEFAVPWPGLPQSVQDDLAKPSDEPTEPFELRYTHFGVKHSQSRRQPLMTAVNIDGLHHVAIKRRGDKWFSDGRIPPEIQLGKADYAHPEIDRGHMVRRQDPNWDDSASPDEAGARVSRIAQQANDDTFHYTNAAVQHSDLNQSTKLWLGLEDFVLDSAQTHGFRACVFTGPILRFDDPEIAPGVIAPMEFFKVVVMKAADGTKLHATAYVLSQGQMIRDLLESRSRLEVVQGFVLGAYRTFQVSLADLGEVTGYDFAHYVPFDPLQQVIEEAADAGMPIFHPLEALEQIVL